jgi:hypothetical protein
MYQSIPKKRNEGPGDVGSFGHEYVRTSQYAKYADDDFMMGNIGFLFYQDKNVQFLQQAFRDYFLKEYNYDVGLQDTMSIAAQMHEAFWEIHEIMFQRRKARVNANLQKNSIRGWEFRPEDNAKRGIPEVRPEYALQPSTVADEHHEEITFEELLPLLNRKTMENMVRIAREKLATYENYHKIYDLRVDEAIRNGGFWSRPEGEGTNRQRRLPTRNPFRFKPRTYVQDTIKFGSIRKKIN